MDKGSISKAGMKSLGGIFDAGYRGEFIMNMLNTSDKEVIIDKGQKAVQMLVQRFEHCDIVEVSELTETVRGAGREGSTGHK